MINSEARIPAKASITRAAKENVTALNKRSCIPKAATRLACSARAFASLPTEFEFEFEFEFKAEAEAEAEAEAWFAVELAVKVMVSIAVGLANPPFPKHRRKFARRGIRPHDQSVTLPEPTCLRRP